MTEAKAKAAKAEVQTSPHIYRFKGDEFTFPPDVKMIQLDALEAFEDGKTVGFVRGVMGNQWGRYKALKPTLGDFEELAKVMGQSYGFEDVGNSAASDVSS